MKKCFKCGETKPLSDFYKHSMMADGHLNKCIVCAKNDVMMHREKNIEKIREYDRNRPNADIRREKNKERNKKYQRTAEQLKEYRRNNKEKDDARRAIRNAIRSGLMNGRDCEVCGSDYRVDAHHEDYSKPLDVVWLCRVCHGKRHKEINEEKRRLASS